MDEVAETLDDVGVEGSFRGKKGHYRVGWLNLLDPFWANHQRDLPGMNKLSHAHQVYMFRPATRKRWGISGRASPQNPMTALLSL